MKSSLERAIARIAADHRSSATALLRGALDVLGRARAAGGAELAAAVRGVCVAQPAMGSLWNAAAAALAGPDTLDRFAHQTARAPDAIARAARPLVEAGAGRPLVLVTWSASGPVRRLLETLAGAGPLSVRCAEARPALEGRSLAAAVARAGARVEVFADGALAAALDGAAAVVVGADAVTTEWFVNKAGTRALALAAAAGGVPTYVLAGRDKGLGPELARHLQLREGPAAEIWARRPRGVKARNPYFERVPWSDVAALVTDRGVVGAADVGELCRAMAAAVGQLDLARLLNSVSFRPSPAGGTRLL